MPGIPVNIKALAQVDGSRSNYVIHGIFNRNLEIYQECQKRWDLQALFDPTASVPVAFAQNASFTHARHIHWTTIRLSRLKLHLPTQPEKVLWVIDRGR